ncbi:hypothetical protein [Marinomonas balearica]|uniref:Uncharacterized protein n=1 Tax=Marinomonas balearica TaxID=491947 RepID=A0A4V3CFX7_9GAMM|nr:hypothetical protein [Marinomonas balearica]TDO95562.1 hypothetical protein DFP79_3493 [Marinomonas balearica]
MKLPFKSAEYLSLIFTKSPFTVSQWRMLFLFQLAVWWPLFSSLLDDYGEVERNAARVIAKIDRDKRQQNSLARWQPPVGVQLSIEKEFDGDVYISGIAVEGTLSLSQWEDVLESLQSTAVFSVEKMSWKRKAGEWQLISKLRVLPPKSNSTFENWLPIDDPTSRLSDVPTVRLVSTLTTKDNHWVKLEHHGKQFWVKNGDWIPSLQATLTGQERRSVTLTNNIGRTWHIEPMMRSGR